jgi:NAD(P)-dependent dehydrogenase (short-subunit alcohol dehydrogenase family)
MDLKISGKVALVGASAGGLGLATAKRLAMEGCHVAMSDVDASRLDDALETVKSAGPTGKMAAYPADFTKPDDLKCRKVGRGRHGQNPGNRGGLLRHNG